MKALSIAKPWAWLVVHGLKDVENRTWRPTYRGSFLIHAGQRLYGNKIERERIRERVWRRFGVVVPTDDELQTGGIIGKAQLVDVVRKSRSFWYEGPYGLVLERARPLPFRRCKG